jgi:hypothetical protein
MGGILSEGDIPVIIREGKITDIPGVTELDCAEELQAGADGRGRGEGVYCCEKLK